MRLARMAANNAAPSRLRKTAKTSSHSDARRRDHDSGVDDGCDSESICTSGGISIRSKSGPFAGFSGRRTLSDFFGPSISGTKHLQNLLLFEGLYLPTIESTTL